MRWPAASFPAIVVLALVGCGDSSGENPTSTETTGAPTTTDPSAGSSSTGVVAESSSGVHDGSSSSTTTSGADTTAAPESSGGESSSTGEVLDYDCDALVEPFVEEHELDQGRGYHDVYFDADGNLLGWDGSAIVRSSYDGDLSVFLPGVDSAQGMDLLANGDLLFTDDYGQVQRVTPDLQVEVIASGLFGAYGITVGPDQQAYVSTDNQVVRIDPDTGDASPFVTLALIGEIYTRAAVFNLDSTQMFISTLTFDGTAPVYVVDLDADLTPTGAATVFAEHVGQGWHDGLGIDACGNLYVPDYNTSGLYRVDPSGVVTTLFAEDFPGGPHYGHGLEWGSGVGGWLDHAMYLPQPYDDLTILELVLGVPSGSTVRTWNGR